MDRLYLNGYIGTLATGLGLKRFLIEHLGKQIPSPALLGQITTRFREAVRAFAQEHEIPWVEFRSKRIQEAKERLEEQAKERDRGGEAGG